MRNKNGVIVILFNMLIVSSTYAQNQPATIQTDTQPTTAQTDTQPATVQTDTQPATTQTDIQSATNNNIPSNLENCIPVDFNIGMTFQAKFPDKTGKYYIIPAEIIDALLEAISKGAVINIDKQPVCQPATEE